MWENIRFYTDVKRSDHTHCPLVPSLVLVRRKSNKLDQPSHLKKKKLWPKIHNIKLTVLALLVALYTFTQWYNHQDCPFPELFHHPKLKLYPLNSNFPSFPQAPDNLYSTLCLYEFTYSKYSKWNHTVLVLFCQTPHFFG